MSALISLIVLINNPNVVELPAQSFYLQAAHFINSTEVGEQLAFSNKSSLQSAVCSYSGQKISLADYATLFAECSGSEIVSDNSALSIRRSKKQSNALYADWNDDQKKAYGVAINLWKGVLLPNPKSLSELRAYISTTNIAIANYKRDDNKRRAAPILPIEAMLKDAVISLGPGWLVNRPLHSHEIFASQKLDVSLPLPPQLISRWNTYRDFVNSAEVRLLRARGREVAGEWFRSHPIDESNPEFLIVRVTRSINRIVISAEVFSVDGTLFDEASISLDVSYACSVELDDESSLKLANSQFKLSDQILNLSTFVDKIRNGIHPSYLAANKSIRDSVVDPEEHEMLAPIAQTITDAIRNAMPEVSVFVLADDRWTQELPRLIESKPTNILSFLNILGRESGIIVRKQRGVICVVPKFEWSRSVSSCNRQLLKSYFSETRKLGHETVWQYCRFLAEAGWEGSKSVFSIYRRMIAACGPKIITSNASLLLCNYLAKFPSSAFVTLSESKVFDYKARSNVEIRNLAVMLDGMRMAIVESGEPKLSELEKLSAWTNLSELREKAQLIVVSAEIETITFAKSSEEKWYPSVVTSTPLEYGRKFYSGKVTNEEEMSALMNSKVARSRSIQSLIRLSVSADLQLRDEATINQINGDIVRVGSLPTETIDQIVLGARGKAE